MFVSGNLNKVEYLERFLGQKVKHHHLDLIEVQSLDSMEVVEHKVNEAYNQLKQPVLIEDTALQINAFGKLPGTFIKFFLSEVGNDGICKMLRSFNDKSAQALVIYGYYDGLQFSSFAAQVKGTVPDQPKGGRGMGWDPIFIPEGQGKTYAQMTEAEYNKYSVRNMAVKKLATFLKN